MFLALAWSSSATAQNWETIDWQVSCTAATKDAILNGAPDDTKALLDGTCNANSMTGPAAIAQHQLEAASVWMRDLGFNGPKIETDHDANGKVRYVAWIDDMSPREKLAREPWGYYDIDSAKLYLNSGYFFAMGDLGKDAYHIAAPTHEMFHAVQASYPALPFTLDHAWIFEGTASAVMLAWLRQSGHGVAVEPKSRDYDRPLHQPLCGRVSGQTHYGCYATQQFWTWLGSELGSEDNVAYLHDVLQQDLTEKSGLAGVNNALVQWNKDGLYDLYPEFIREVASTPGYFSSAGTDKLTLQYTGKKKKEHLDGQVGPLASNAVQVKIRIPKELSARLTIEFKQDHEDLHLIVDGARLDKNQKQRNHFETTLSGQPAAHEFLVRVANVAPDVANSESRPYTLIYTLEPIGLTLFFSSRIQQSFPGGQLISQYEAEIPLIAETDSTYEGTAPLVNVEYSMSILERAGCSVIHNANAKMHARMVIPKVNANAPDFIESIKSIKASLVPPDKQSIPRSNFNCPFEGMSGGLGLGFADTWWPVFVVLHGKEGAREFHFTNWKPSDDPAVLARAVYNESRTIKRQTVSAHTTMEIRRGAEAQP